MDIKAIMSEIIYQQYYQDRSISIWTFIYLINIKRIQTLDLKSNGLIQKYNETYNLLTKYHVIILSCCYFDAIFCLFGFTEG